MVNRPASDAAPPQSSVAPVVKRKRRASCLGEQERRDRKRAIDREAQRSLREKTKTHIAELERTIQILRDQDRTGATSSLLSEIAVLRAENERLRDVIDSVKSVIGCDPFPRGNAGNRSGNDGGQPSPKIRTISFANDTKPALSTPLDSHNPFDFQERILASNRPLDLDGMTIMAGSEADMPAVPDPNIGMDLHSEPIFGPNWRCPSPVVLHIGNPEPSRSSPSSAACPVWKKSNELFGKVFDYRSTETSSAGTGTSLITLPKTEAHLLYQAIQKGWDKTSNEWLQSPALLILKQPTLRDRLGQNHTEIFQHGDRSKSYSSGDLRFDWPFAFQDAFFHDGRTDSRRPSSLFERYHRDLKYRTVDIKFYARFPDNGGGSGGGVREGEVRWKEAGASSD
ncbi:hypothetical protein BDU57DRAFT_589156 [Ampelomyces quisqualis]|uniref:BZIP domain-containing protein n=1 Tax=Ampelomyces quisqualis TaxID=50730 RepID=A0A6A5QDP6_AMPQU|nr:hypothetical protein BDU57DRAFT_589156 [Ampelomyces quisqualis]